MFQETFRFGVAIAFYYNMQTSPKIIGCVPLHSHDMYHKLQ
jgi:hypothetical protein